MAEWILTAIIFLPIVGAVAVALQPDRPGRTLRVALLFACLTLGLTSGAVGLFIGNVDSTEAFSLTQRLGWLDRGAEASSLDIAYHVGVDGISIWLVALTSFLVPLVILASASSIRERSRAYYMALLVLQTGMTGVFCALDMLLLFVFFEFTLIPLYLIIGIWGGPERRQAANKFFIYTMAGSVLTFAGLLYIAWHGYVAGGRVSLTCDIQALYAMVGEPGWLSPAAQWWLFLALFAGFAIKVPLFPLHTWLPLAHTEAPTGGSVLLAGVLLKLGTYGFLRLSLPLLPAAALALAPTMAVLAIMGIVYGALVAWVQTDVKKLVAYSSVSHLGFCILGMFSLKMAGVSGSVLYMINHGLSTGALFLIVGMIYERYHTRDIHKISGLARVMPQMAVFLLFFTFSSIGLPGLNGFVSEFLVLLGTAMSPTSYDAFPAGNLGFAYAVPAATGIMLGAVYMLWMCRRVLFGPLVQPQGTPDISAGLSPDLTIREKTVLLPLAVTCLVLGVYPKVVQDSIDPAIRSNILAYCHGEDPNAADVTAAPEGIHEALTVAGSVGGLSPGHHPALLEPGQEDGR